MKLYTTDISVRYGETDKMGVAHHSSYLLWFELGRTGLLKECGHSYRELEEIGVLLPVIEYNCKFFVGADYDDTVRIETGIEELKSRTLTFSYSAFRGDQLLATGWTRHLCVDGKHRYRRIPAELTTAVAPFLKKDDRAIDFTLD